jgi:hypothetical protein
MKNYKMIKYKNFKLKLISKKKLLYPDNDEEYQMKSYLPEY